MANNKIKGTNDLLSIGLFKTKLLEWTNENIKNVMSMVLKDVKSISFKNKKRLLVINKLADNIFKIIVMNPNTNFLENQNLIMEVEGLKKVNEDLSNVIYDVKVMFPLNSVFKKEEYTLFDKYQDYKNAFNNRNLNGVTIRLMKLIFKKAELRREIFNKKESMNAKEMLLRNQQFLGDTTIAEMNKLKIDTISLREEIQDLTKLIEEINYSNHL